MPPELGDGWVLRVIDADLAISGDGDGEWGLGREADSALVVAEAGVSRHHARVEARAGGVTIEDLGSANGTIIERVGELIPVQGAVALADGDVVRLGTARLRFEWGSPAAPDPTSAQPWGGGIHVPTVAAGFSHFAVGFFIWALPAVLATDIAATHGLSPIEAKILPATAILVGAPARLAFGFVTDSRGPLISGSAALAIGLLALVVLAVFGDSVLVVWIGVAVLGVGLASLPVALPLVSTRTVPDRRGLALGIMASGSVGIVLAALAGPALADALDWRSVFALALIPSSLGLAVFGFWGAGGLGAAAAGGLATDGPQPLVAGRRAAVRRDVRRVCRPVHGVAHGAAGRRLRVEPLGGGGGRGDGGPGRCGVAGDRRKPG